jgi:hypothetical protein
MLAMINANYILENEGGNLKDINLEKKKQMLLLIM